MSSDRRPTIAYVGDENPALRLWRGHPGRVIDGSNADDDLTVSFVNGPSLTVRKMLLEELDMATYVARGDRLVACRHPLHDTPIEGLAAPGHEWPEGSRPED